MINDPSLNTDNSNKTIIIFKTVVLYTRIGTILRKEIQ